MSITRRLLLKSAASPLALSLWSTQARSTSPHEVVRVLAGFPAGGSVDLVSRRLAEAMQGRFGKVQMVENRAGAGGRLAIDAVRQAAPDGRTYLVCPSGMFTVYPHIYPRLNYGLDDVTPVGTVCNFDYAWAIGPAVPASVVSLGDYVRWLKGARERQAYASPALGSQAHFIGTMFANALDLPLTHVGYRGSAPAIQDLLGGQIAALSTTLPDLLGYMRDARLRVLAVASKRRSPFMPDVPTFGEQGFAQLEMEPDYLAVLLPRGAPAALVSRLSQALRDALQMEQLQQGLRSLGQEPGWKNPVECAADFQRDLLRWAPIVKATGFVAE